MSFHLKDIVTIMDKTRIVSDLMHKQEISRVHKVGENNSLGISKEFDLVTKIIFKTPPNANAYLSIGMYRLNLHKVLDGEEYMAETCIPLCALPYSPIRVEFDSLMCDDVTVCYGNLSDDDRMKIIKECNPYDAYANL